MVNNGPASTTSVWWDELQSTNERPRLASDITADLCVVGAGIAGLSVAYEATLAGLSVVVIEDGTIGSGETGHTTAHLVNALDDRYFELEKLHGAEGARLAAESHSRAIDRIEAIVRIKQMDCEFVRRDGYLFVPPGENTEILDRELAAAKRAGLRKVQRIDRAPIAGFETGPALLFPGQGQIHAGKYLNALARAVEERGKIFGNTHATSITGGDSPKVVTRGGHTISAGAVAVCTNTPVNDMVAVHTKQMPYRTYVIAGRVPQGAVTPALYWDTADPYHYVRLKGDGSGDDVLIVGGDDHKTGQFENISPGERYASLERWARERWPKMGEIEYRWSGQVMEPDDGLAFIGRNPLDEKNIYIATGDSGNGITHGVIAGMLISELLQGRENPWAKLYEPRRIRLRATGEWIKENANTFAQYRDHATPGEVASVEEIAVGEGAVVREGLQKVACYRDETGCVHRMSAVCPHLGAVVRWNPAEKSWDCPAHGSRFSADGVVINGPANSDLPRVNKDEQEAA